VCFLYKNINIYLSFLILIKYIYINIAKWYLTTPEDYHYLNQSDCYKVKDMDDAQCYKITKVLLFFELWKMILLLGLIFFQISIFILYSVNFVNQIFWIFIYMFSFHYIYVIFNLNN